MVSTLDREFTVPVYSEQCLACRHFLGWREGRTIGRCEAFDEIPLAIWTGETDHRQPVEGDHGIRFDAAAGMHSPFEGAGS